MKKKILVLVLTLAAIIALFSVVAVATDVPSEPSLKIEAANLSFEDSVFVLYAVSHEGIEYDDVQMLFWTTPQDEYTVGTEAYAKDYFATNVNVNSQACTVFKNNELRAKNMADNVYARAYAKVDGKEYYSEVSKYSILQYAYNKLGKTATESESETLCEMLTKMLTYGAAAQKHFNHNTARPADGDFYQIKVEGGVLEDGFTKGLYLASESATLTAPETKDGKSFSAWKNSAGEVISTEATATLTGFTKNETFTAAYEVPSITYSEGLAYTLSYDETYYIVSGIGNCTDTDVVIPSEYNGLPVKEIGAWAFYYCSSLTSVTIGNSVTSIGICAFEDCSSLTSVTIPDSVTEIGSSAFFGCSSLTSVTIGNSVTEIGRAAFRNCSSLTSVYYNGSEAQWDEINIDYNNDTLTNTTRYYYSETQPTVEGNFWHYVNGVPTVWPVYVAPSYSEGLAYTLSYDETYYIVSGIGNCTDTDVVIPSEYNGLPVKAIGDYAFWRCSSLTSVTIPDSVTSIGSDAFSYCSNLVSITIPDSVTSIGSDAFSNCSSLTSVTIGNSVTSIGEDAFVYCTSLTSVTIPDSVTEIGSFAFAGCSSLTSVTIGNSVTSIGEDAFVYCTSLTSITIPDSVTSIGDYAFVYCTSLTSIIVTEGNTAYQSIDGNLYSIDSKNLIQYAIGKTDTHFDIPDSVTEIGDAAFANCSSLTSITIPDSVTSIGVDAFYDCNSLIVKENGIHYVDKWVVNCDSGVTVGNLRSDTKGIADFAFYDCSSLTSITIPDSVTSIGEDAFYGCSSLTSITIPDSVISIGEHAFYDCSSLTSITIPDSVTSIGEYAFYNCRSLTSVTIPDSVTSIGRSAFCNCSSLTSVTIGDSVTSIGEYAFCGCTSLTSVTIPDSVTEIGSYAFYDCDSLTSVTIGNSVTEIGSSAFSSCSSLTSIIVTEGNTAYQSIDGNLYSIDSKTLIQYAIGKTDTHFDIPDSVISIGEWAFMECSSLTSVTIPDSVTSIGIYAFAYCTSLTSVTIGDSVTSIGEDAFVYCTSLTSVTIPDSVTEIGSSAFSSCSSLTSIIVTEGNTAYQSIDGNLYSIDSKTLIQYAIGKTDTHFDIPDSVTEIDSYAFSGCSSLTSVTIGNSVTEIGYAAFSDCSSLTSITIPDSVTSIGDYAFYYCSSLTSVTIPDSVTEIGYAAFFNCDNLTSVYYKGTEAQWSEISIGSNNAALTKATRYYYSETAPTTEGNFWHYVNGVPAVWTKE